MIIAASKYGGVKADKAAALARVQTSAPTHGAAKDGKRAPNIFIPTLVNHKAQFQDWYWKELREGGMLFDYLRRERALSARRIRQVARKMHKVQRNLKSDFELKAAVPAREFFRWKAEDKDFWRDDKNLKSLKRDNPEMAIFV